MLPLLLPVGGAAVDADLRPGARPAHWTPSPVPAAVRSSAGQLPTPGQLTPELETRPSLRSDVGGASGQ